MPMHSEDTLAQSRKSRYALYLLVMAGCGGLLFDFGGTIIGPALAYIGPSTENPGSLGLFDVAEISHLSSAVVMCAALACLGAGWLTERFGRKPIMLFAAVLAAFACVPICFSQLFAAWSQTSPYPWFFVGRALQGASAGLIGVVVPMYLAECLSAESRGKGAAAFQLFDFVGISFCSLVGLAVVHLIGAADNPAVSVAQKELAWKTVFWSSAVPAVLFFVGVLGLRESPCWLAKRQASLSASDTFAKVPHVAQDTLLQRKYVLPFCISLAILVCNQAIGFNAVQYFSIPLFTAAGLSHATASAANVIVWLVPLPVTAFALWLVDRAGRKPILKCGTIGMTVALAAVAIIFGLLESHALTKAVLSGWLTVASVALFVASFSLGPGVVVWLALSELMPSRIRANGMAICLFVNQLVAFALADAFLQWQRASGYCTVFIFLALFAFLYFLCAAFLLPETKGRTLEEIEAYFANGGKGPEGTCK